MRSLRAVVSFLLAAAVTLALTPSVVEAGNLRGFTTKQLDCPTLPDIHQGTRKVNSATSVTYKCNKGCVMSGADTLTCSNGRWNRDVPSCRVEYLKKKDNSFKNHDKGYQLYSG